MTENTHPKAGEIYEFVPVSKRVCIILFQGGITGDGIDRLPRCIGTYCSRFEQCSYEAVKAGADLITLTNLIKTQVNK